MNKRRYINPLDIKEPQNFQEKTNNQQKQIKFPWMNPQLQESNHFPNQFIFQPYLRSVTNIFPSNKSTADGCKIPLGLHISPAVDLKCPVVDCRETGFVPRCKSCSSYLCPQVKIKQQENTWICPLCGTANAIPSETVFINNYSLFQQTNQNFISRVECQNAVYDIVAPKSYNHINAEPMFCFVVDMSFQALSIGFTQQMLLSIKSSLDSLQPNTRVGLIAMSYNLILFDLVNSIQIVIPDLSDFDFRFNQNNLFPKLKNCKEQLCNAIDELLQKKINQNIDGNCIGSALYLCEQIMTNIGVIIVAGIAGLPKYGPFKLNNRTIVDNDELPLLRLPVDGSGNIFKEIALKMNRKSISVHLFSAGQQFLDLSVVAVPSGFTCGECKHYSVFDEYSRMKMHSDIFHTLTNQYFWDSYIKLRTTNGCKLTNIFANCTICRDNFILFPVISREDTISFELSVTEQGISNKNIICQFEMVYTNNDGCRMIRVFTIEMPVSKDVGIICSSVDEASLATMICKKACKGVLQKGPIFAVQSIRNEIQTMMNQKSINFCSINHLLHAMFSNVTFRSRHPEGVDGRMSQIIMLRSLNITNTLLYLYPRMICVDNETILPLTSASFAQGTIFLFHTVDKIYIWINAAVDKSFLENAFGCQDLQNLPKTFPSTTTQANKDSEEYLKLEKLISKCNELSGNYLTVEIIGQENPRESVFSEFIVDDSTISGSNLTNWIQNIGLLSP